MPDDPSQGITDAVPPARFSHGYFQRRKHFFAQRQPSSDRPFGLDPVARIATAPP